jgi:chemotaxis protein histidine kinase CheA
MPPDADEALARRMRQLRAEYLAASTQRVGELRALSAKLTENQAATLTELRRAFHRLAGSGGSYGFAQISAASREGELLLQRLESQALPLADADRVAINDRIAAIAEAFAEAAAAPDDGAAD